MDVRLTPEFTCSRIIEAAAQRAQSESQARLEERGSVRFLVPHGDRHDGAKSRGVEDDEVTAPDCRAGLWLGVRIRDLGDACSVWHRPRRPPSCPSGMRAGTLRCKVAREYW